MQPPLDAGALTVLVGTGPGDVFAVSLGGLLGMGFLDGILGSGGSDDDGDDDLADEGGDFFNDDLDGDLGGMEAPAENDEPAQFAGPESELAPRVDEIESDIERLAGEVEEVESGTSEMKAQVREMEETIEKMGDLRDEIHDLGW